MGITEDLNTWWDILKDYKASNSARLKFVGMMSEIDTALNVLQDMNQNGDFDELPESWRTKAIWAWQQLDNARQTIKADGEFMEGINWTP